MGKETIVARDLFVRTHDPFGRITRTTLKAHSRTRTAALLSLDLTR